MGLQSTRLKTPQEFDKKEKYNFKKADSYVNIIDKEEGYPVEIQIIIEFNKLYQSQEQIHYLKCFGFILNDGNKLTDKSETEYTEKELTTVFNTPIILPYKFEAKNNAIIKLCGYTNQEVKFEYFSKSIIHEVSIPVAKIIRTKEVMPFIMYKKNTKIEIGTIKLIAKTIKNESKQQLVSFRPIINIKQNASECFFALSLSVSDKSSANVLVYKSEVKSGSSQFDFDVIELLTSDLTDETTHLQKMIKLDLFEYVIGNHKYLGSSIFSVEQISQGKKSIELYNNTNSIGIVQFEQFNYFTQYIFTEFLNAGLEIQAFVAIDFTKSNLLPNDPKSLHSINLSDNHYYNTIKAVVPLVIEYDTDKQIPLLGFGAKWPGTLGNKASHCFACSGNIFEPELDRIDGVIQGYSNALNKVEFHGPTCFGKVLLFCRECIDFELKKKEVKYYILLLITDGIIDDLDDTIEEIVKMSSLPISIIIVGVGKEDFFNMEILTSKNSLLYSSKLKKSAKRNIVQFVKYEDVKGDINEIRKQTLKEVPRQVMAYMRENQKTPEVLSPLLNHKIEEDKNSYFNELKEQMTEELRKDEYNDAQIKLVLDGGIHEYSKEIAINKIKQNNPNNYASLPNQQNSEMYNPKNLPIYQSESKFIGKNSNKMFEEKKEIYL